MSGTNTVVGLVALVALVLLVSNSGPTGQVMYEMYCADPDGDDPLTPGIAKGRIGFTVASEEFYDYCDGNYLVERLCSGNQIVEKKYDCGAGSRCVAGWNGAAICG